MAPVPLPFGYHSVNPYFVVDRAEDFVAFLVDVFAGTVQGDREVRSDGSVDHADVLIGDSLIMISAASEKYPARPCVNFVYVTDVDATYTLALEAGCREIIPPRQQDWGDRVAGIFDPFDNRWWIATHLRGFT
jgi:PhnB protein